VLDLANATNVKKDKHDIEASNARNRTQTSPSTLMPHYISLSSIYRYLEDEHVEAGESTMVCGVVSFMFLDKQKPSNSQISDMNIVSGATLTCTQFFSLRTVASPAGDTESQLWIYYL
jgi:hypothetical protein